MSEQEYGVLGGSKVTLLQRQRRAKGGACKAGPHDTVSKVECFVACVVGLDCTAGV